MALKLFDWMSGGNHEITEDAESWFASGVDPSNKPPELARGCRAELLNQTHPDCHTLSNPLPQGLQQLWFGEQ